MSDVAAASSFARRLVEAEARSSRIEMRKAARAVAGRLRISAGSVWGLLYSPPKQIGTVVFRALRAGVERQLEHEIRRLTHELHVLRQSGADPRCSVVAEVETHLAAARSALGLSAP